MNIGKTIYKHEQKIGHRRMVMCMALMLYMPVIVMAQDSVDLRPLRQKEPTMKKLDCRLTLEAGVGSFFGKGYAFTGVAPEVRYHFNDRFSLSAGMKLTEGFGLGMDYGINARGGRNLAPRRSGTRLYQAYISGEYQVNERLWIAASLLHIGGTVDFVPWYGMTDGTVSATALSAELRYKTRRGNMLVFHLSYINDNGGIMAPYLYSPYLNDPCWDSPFWYGESLRCGFGRSFGFYY